MPASMYLVRHGETVWNLERRMQGRRDSPLTLRGIRQAESLGLWLAKRCDRETCTIVASPLGRCWQTAVILSEMIGLKASDIHFDPDLQEISWGRWDGHTASEIETREPALWQKVIDSNFAIAPPGGESTSMVWARAQRWLQNNRQELPGILVSHGMMGRALRSVYQDLPQSSLYGASAGHDECFEFKDGMVISHMFEDSGL